jgi:hypothetical protein
MHSKPINVGIYWFLPNIFAFTVAIPGFLVLPSRRAAHVSIDPEWAAAEPFDAKLLAHTFFLDEQYDFANIVCVIASMN